METGEKIDPHYGTVLKLKTEAGVPLEVDCGVVLRAIDALLMIAPRELRSPADWMFKLYRQREAIANAATDEIHAATKEIIDAEGDPEPDDRFREGHGAGESFGGPFTFPGGE